MDLLVDPWSGNYFDLEAAKFVKPIGIEHFFDAFSVEKKRPLKVDAASALNIPVNEVSDSLVVSQDKAKRFELTPVWAPAEPPTKRAKTLICNLFRFACFQFVFTVSNS